MASSQQFQELSCPACATLTPHSFLFRKNDCHILKCTSCGLGRARTVGFDPRSYYTADYFSGGHPDGYSDYLATGDVLRAQFQRELRFIRRHCPSGRLIEIGCAYGFFLQEAKTLFDVAGIELSEHAAAHCRGAGLNVLTGVADNENLDHLAPADAIVLLDVIEHVSDPFDTLERCCERLRPNGSIILTTGDFASLAARLAGAHWRLMTPPQHLWFFTVDSFRAWAGRIGMRVEN